MGWSNGAAWLSADGGWYKNVSGGGGLDPATTAWVAAVVSAGGTVSGGQQTNVNNLIVALKGHGLFAKLDRMWLYASENATQASIDIVNLATHSLSGTPTFTANQGYTGNGSAFINTNFVGTVNGVNMTNSGASIAAYIRNNRTSSSNITAIGAQNGTGSDQTSIQVNAFGSQNIGTMIGQIAVAGATTSQGLWVTSGTPAASNFYRNGSSIGSVGTGTGTVPAEALFALAFNNNGSAIQISTDQIAVVSLGGNLSSTDETNLSADVNGLYMTALGTNVY